MCMPTGNINQSVSLNLEAVIHLGGNTKVDVQLVRVQQCHRTPSSSISLILQPWWIGYSVQASSSQSQDKCCISRQHSTSSWYRTQNAGWEMGLSYTASTFDRQKIFQQQIFGVSR